MSIHTEALAALQAAVRAADQMVLPKRRLPLILANLHNKVSLLEGDPQSFECPLGNLSYEVQALVQGRNLDQEDSADAIYVFAFRDGLHTIVSAYEKCLRFTGSLSPEHYRILGHMSGMLELINAKIGDHTHPAICACCAREISRHGYGWVITGIGGGHGRNISSLSPAFGDVTPEDLGEIVTVFMDMGFVGSERAGRYVRAYLTRSGRVVLDTLCCM